VKLYKLTCADGTTKGGMLWGEGVTHSVTGQPKLCSKTVLHAYQSPLLAVLLDPCHGSFGVSGKLWEAEGEVVVSALDKVGCQTLTTIREIPKPVITTEQRVRFAILVAKAVFKGNAKWEAWADGWLSGENRSVNAAYAAANAADAAVNPATGPLPTLQRPTHQTPPPDAEPIPIGDATEGQL
jgi:hypothetical protein